MSNIPHDIKDSEIRIISSGPPEGHTARRPRKKALLIVLISIAAAVACVAALMYVKWAGDKEKLELVTKEASLREGANGEAPAAAADSIAEETALPAAGYVAVSDTVAGAAPLTIFRPVNLTPSLAVSTQVLSDSTVRFVVQAADVRSDNGGIVGAYVDRGELLSKGQAKAGFCAIIGGKITVGVADATPLLEQALETDGYFFRQYPLVVGNQVVENKPKGASLRKALAELHGSTAVIMSREPMTFHDFSQALADLGVTNAIYLVGGKGYGFAVDADGNKIEFGRLLPRMHPNTNYIVWR